MLRLLSLLPASWTRQLIQQAGLIGSARRLGVRIIVEDGQGQVLLVRHSYIAGWYLPGGGVDRGETLSEAACRELREETGIVAEAPPALLGVYLNPRGGGRDHVGLFHLSAWREGPDYLAPNREIAEAAFFSADALPEEVSAATARRLAAFRAGGIDAAGHW